MAAKKLSNKQVLDEWVLDPTRKDPELVTAAVSLGTATPGGNRATLLTELRDHLRALPADADCAWQPKVANAVPATPPAPTTETTTVVKPTAWKCPKCGRSASAEADFCPKCGTPRSKVVATTTAVTNGPSGLEKAVRWFIDH